MKKISAVLTILMVAFSMSAVINTNSAFTASLKLVPILPQFNIYAGFDGINYTAMGAEHVGPFNPESPATYDLVCDTDLSEDSVTVYIKMLQFGKAHYSTAANGHAPIYLSVSATALILDSDADYKTAVPEIVDDSIWEDVYIDVDEDLEGKNDFISRHISTVGPVIKYRIEYPTGIMVPAVVRNEPVAVGGFAYRWLPNEDLIAGNYQANILMEYTVV